MTKLIALHCRATFDRIRNGVITMKKIVHYENVRDNILEVIEGKLDKVGIVPSEVKDSLDLLQSGILDSLDFFELIDTLEEDYDLTVNLAEMVDPDIAKLGVFIREIVQQNC